MVYKLERMQDDKWLFFLSLDIVKYYPFKCLMIKAWFSLFCKSFSLIQEVFFRMSGIFKAGLICRALSCHRWKIQWGNSCHHYYPFALRLLKASILLLIIKMISHTFFDWMSFGEICSSRKIERSKSNILDVRIHGLV